MALLVYFGVELPTSTDDLTVTISDAAGIQLEKSH